MISWQLRLLNRLLPIFLRLPLRLIARPTPRMRRLEAIAGWVLRRPDAVTYRPQDEPNGLWAVPLECTDDAAILYLHGGAFIMGSASTHKSLAGRLAELAGARAFLPLYRLAPEHPFPAALDDAIAAYRHLTDAGYARIALCGDSAGGGLAFALLQVILDENLPRPVAVGAFSPWTDLACGSDSLTRNARTEVSLPIERIRAAAAWYHGDRDPTDRRVSPVYGRFAGAPPVLIQVSDAEALEDDSQRIAARLRADGVRVMVQTWTRTPHVWQVYFGYVPEADDALSRAATFLRSRIDGADTG